MSKNSDRKNRGLYVALGAFGLLAGIGTSFLLVGHQTTTLAPTVQVSQSVSASPSPSDSMSSSESATPTPSPTKSVKPTPKPTVTKASNSTSTPPKPSPKPTSTSGGSTGGGSSKPTACPATRGEDPATWDACRAGYIAPTIAFDSIVSCKPYDSTGTIWVVVQKFKVVGGNYRTVSWSGLNNNASGTNTVYLRGIHADQMTSELPMSVSADLSVGSMNGLPGNIDYITWDSRVMVTYANYCR